LQFGIEDAFHLMSAFVSQSALNVNAECRVRFDSLIKVRSESWLRSESERLEIQGSGRSPEKSERARR